MKRAKARGHGWIGTGKVSTRLGDFECVGSYPARKSEQRLRDALTFNRAVEAFLVQMHGVSWMRIGAWRRRLRGGEEVSDSHD
jgi:hypothetical protein